MISPLRMMPLTMDPDSPEGRQHVVDLISWPFKVALKDGRDGLGVIDLDAGKARITAKRERRQAGRTDG
jgi:hypothetical protein